MVDACSGCRYVAEDGMGMFERQLANILLFNADVPDRPTKLSAASANIAVVRFAKFAFQKQSLVHSRWKATNRGVSRLRIASRFHRFYTQRIVAIAIGGT